jgi:hypothetical protein
METVFKFIGIIIYTIIMVLVSILETVLKILAVIAITPLVIGVCILNPIFKNCSGPKFLCDWYSYATDWRYWPITRKFKEWYKI